MSMLTALGKAPSGKFKKSIEQSPNFYEGEFKNAMPTSTLTQGHSMVRLTLKFLNKSRDCYPPAAIPSVYTDLFSLNSSQPVVVWFGHSSYFIRIHNQNILVDPVFSNHAGPFSGMNKAFEGTNVYRAANMPPIDLLVITHDHYDHLDYETVKSLRSKVKQVCTSVGVSSHLQAWGFDASVITELDWYQSGKFAQNLQLTALPARHFSGRMLKRNQTFWSSFMLEAGYYKIFIGGDSGYGSHYEQIGNTCGPFDLALLECGQYNLAWHDIHMLPQETVQAAIDLGAAVLMPVHWGKFCISLHAWNEPIEQVTAIAKQKKVKITTPKIGEPVVIGRSYPAENWWQEVLVNSSASQ